jgi:hypothetical protein
MLRNLVAFVLIARAAPALAGDLSITEITVDPSPALPGEPIWVTISIRNEGSPTVAVPLGGLLEATPEGGEPRVLKTFLGRPLSPLERAGYKEFKPTVGPGETLRLDFTNGSFADGWLLETPQLWQPGRHRLRVVLFDGEWTISNAGTAIGRVPWTELQGSGYLTKPPIASSTAIFHVREPAGEDAAAWKEFMRRTNRRGWVNQKAEDNGAIAYELALEFPDSAYAPYFAMAARPRLAPAARQEAERRLHEDIATRHPRNAIFAEVMQRSAALDKAHGAREAPDLATALAMLEEGRALLEKYVSETPRLLTRLQWQTQLALVPTRESLEHVFETRRKNKSQRME